MKATHVDYLHKGHLRVVTGKTYVCVDSRGYYETDAECVSPGAKCYKDLYRKGLPKWPDGQGRTIVKERPDLQEKFDQYVEELKARMGVSNESSTAT